MIIVQTIIFPMDGNGNSRRIHVVQDNGQLYQTEYVGYVPSHTYMPDVFLSRGHYAGMKWPQLCNLPTWTKERNEVSSNSSNG